MRLPTGWVKHGRERAARALAVVRARAVTRERSVTPVKRGRRRPAQALSGLAKRGRKRPAQALPAPVKHTAESLERALAAAVVDRRADRLGQALGVALVCLMGGGAAGAVALLPADLRGAGGERAGAAPSRIAVGQLVAAAVSEPQRPGRAYYRKTAARRVPASTGSGFLPLYREAARTFGVSWRLLASIHRQETAFSTAPTTYHGLNAFGCCAGPMQFNVTNGPPSTWALYRQSFRAGDRPRRYPHPTRHHPSIYDDFDAIMAAAALLRDSGAGELLDGGAWSAAYAYYGHDLYGVDYASEVVARAQGWEISGFCLNCPVDGTLVAALDDAYGGDARAQLLTAEEREKLEHEKRRKRKREKAARARQRAAEKAAAEDARRLEELRRPSRERKRSDPAPAPTQTTPDPTSTTTAPEPAPATEAPPPAPPPDCRGLKKLLGCG